MQNPFVYGEVVPPAAFVNRVVELDRLIADLASSQKIFLISPRRYGKSSLIQRAMASMDRGRIASGVGRSGTCENVINCPPASSRRCPRLELQLAPFAIPIAARVVPE